MITIMSNALLLQNLTMAADDFKARLAAQIDLIRKPDFDFKLKGISDRVTKIKLITCWLKMN